MTAPTDRQRSDGSTCVNPDCTSEVHVCESPPPLPDDAMLAEYVRESNAIENIYARSGEPLYDDHLGIATSVSDDPGLFTGDLYGPREIHGILMASEPSATPGVYRTADVTVGGHRTLPWRAVPAAMESLLERAAMLPDSIGGGEGDSGDYECWYFHNEFEAIHPFRDGNGRTGRLFLNALRLACGLPWLIVYARDRQAYYQRIRDWEATHGD